MGNLILTRRKNETIRVTDTEHCNRQYFELTVLTIRVDSVVITISVNGGEQVQTVVRTCQPEELFGGQITFESRHSNQVRVVFNLPARYSIVRQELLAVKH